MKSTLTTQKLNADETLQQEKLRIRNEEEKKQHEMEQRLRTLTSTKDELEVSGNEKISVALEEHAFGCSPSTINNY